MFIAIVFWKAGLNAPGLLSLVLVSAAIIVAAFLLEKGVYWVSFPMMALGGYILYALQHGDPFGQVFLLEEYGPYLIIHYLVLSMW